MLLVFSLCATVVNIVVVNVLRLEDKGKDLWSEDKDL